MPDNRSPSADTRSLKIVFMGTPEFSVPALRNLIANPNYDVIAVYTQPPRPKGRGQQVQPSPVHEVANENGIPVFTPKSLKKDPDAVMNFLSLNADVAVVAAYGLILPKAVLDAPRYGCLNIHASLLPRWRGASPIQQAILAGDATSGVTIMQMEEGLDTGPMLLKRTVTIHDATTASSLHDELSALGSAMIEDVLDLICAGTPPEAEIQEDALATYAPMLTKEDGKIDWNNSAWEIDCRVRALTPWPGTWTILENGKRFKILDGQKLDASEKAVPGTLLGKDGAVSCGDGALYRIARIQPDGSKPMDVAAAINGGYLAVGERCA
jgi:methionyl-tRNA formyltransferase